MSGSRWVMRLWESWRWVRLVRLARLRGRLSRKLSERSSKERLEERGARLEDARENSPEETRWS